MLKKFVLLCVLLSATSVQAGNASVFEYTVKKPVDQVYKSLYQALEADGFYVVFEVNVGRNISRFAEKWGDNYNRNQLSAIRSMVFCNGWYANAVSNADPSMLALCPLRLSLIEKNGTSTALFVRPTVVGADSPAYTILQRIENEVIDAIKKGMQ